MPNQTPFFQAFGPLLFGRPARAALERLSKLDSLQELYAIFGDLFPQRLLSPTEKGANSRRRSLPAQVTFWAFVWQVLSPGSSCRETEGIQRGRHCVVTFERRWMHLLIVQAATE